MTDHGSSKLFFLPEHRLGYIPASTGGQQAREVYIVDGLRTPFLKAKGVPGDFSASDLAVAAAKPLLLRQSFAPEDLDEVILGCVIPSPDEANIARIVALRLGCGESVPAFTVQRNCATGMQAIDTAAMNIATGRSDLVLAGGTESMSHAPLLLREQLVRTLGKWKKAKGISASFRSLKALRPAHFAPDIALLHGLTDPLSGLSMGQTAENLATRFQIHKEAMDSYAHNSNLRLIKAQDAGVLQEIIPVFNNKGRFFDADDGVHRDSSMEKLGKLRPMFDRGFGNITAGNSAQVTDGAAMLLLASKEAVERYKLSVLGRLHDCNWAGLSPDQMGLGPVYAMGPLLQRNGLKATDVDYWEINEAFAAQVLACLAAWEDEEFMRNEVGVEALPDPIPMNRLNVEGGAIALGHPVGASGARLVLHLLHVLRRNSAHVGVASLCIGGGQGGAMLLEALSEEDAS